MNIYGDITGLPLTNADLKEHQLNGSLKDLQVMLGIIEVDAKWWNNQERLEMA